MANNACRYSTSGTALISDITTVPEPSTRVWACVGICIPRSSSDQKKPIKFSVSATRASISCSLLFFRGLGEGGWSRCSCGTHVASLLLL
uniref:Uncharacterized protein n=1 Tax=Rhizophora mucronata TaxID=61149 RepID=A0A2P2PX03_RHIMU